MKNATKIKVLALAVLACMLLTLAACGEKTPAELTYKVTVADALGNPYTTGVVVSFLQNGKQAAMQVVGANGVAEKTLPTGDYTVELMFTGDEAGYHYDKTGLTLSAEKTELTVTLASTSLFTESGEVPACHVTTGEHQVVLREGERNYFLFAPTQPGTYQFTSSDANAQIGYYGAPHFVQSHSAAEVADNSFTISVSEGMIGTGDTGTSVYVIGIDASGVTGCKLSVVRTGEPEHTLADEPWTVYEKTVELSAYTLPEGTVLEDFDLTASSDTYKLVLGADGFYHLGSAAGPLVYVRLGVDSEYLACFKTIVDKSGVVKYFFDENDAFIKKESYTECLMEYIACMDESSGVYPLTEDLKYIIQQRGDYSGWFDKDADLYLFKDANGSIIPGINAEISWLFMCCYAAG